MSVCRSSVVGAPDNFGFRACNSEVGLKISRFAVPQAVRHYVSDLSGIHI
jgi:hypothetical protein